MRALRLGECVSVLLLLLVQQQQQQLQHTLTSLLLVGSWATAVTSAV